MTAPTTQIIETQSDLFSAMNRVRSRLIKEGHDPKRINRAFGILQSKNGESRLLGYNATTTTCECPDRQYRNELCKHMTARLIQAEVIRTLEYKTIVIRLWAQTYDPRNIINWRIDEIGSGVTSEIEVLQNGNFRPAKKDKFGVIEYLHDNDYTPYVVFCYNQKNGPAGWRGQYQITFVKK